MERETFYHHLNEWESHCEKPSVKFSSAGDLERACAAYWDIVSMGEEALPYIREVYEMDESGKEGLAFIKAHGLVAAVKDILREEFWIPPRILGNIPAIQTYTAHFIDDYLDGKGYD